jgi:hypothetical protein
MERIRQLHCWVILMPGYFDYCYFRVWSLCLQVFQTDIRDHLLAKYPHLSMTFRGRHGCPFLVNRFHCTGGCQMLNQENWNGLPVLDLLFLIKQLSLVFNIIMEGHKNRVLWSTLC